MGCQQRLELGSHTLPVDVSSQRGHGVSLEMTGIGTKWKQHPVCQDDREAHLPGRWRGKIKIN